MIIKGNPIVLTHSFTATGQSGSVPVFGEFSVSIWGTPLNGDGTSGAFVGTVRLERSADGGTTWVPASTDGVGTVAMYSATTAVQGTEFFTGATYRFNCINYTSGTIDCMLDAPGWLLE